MPEIGFDEEPISPVMRDETTEKKKPNTTIRAAASRLPCNGMRGAINAASQPGMPPFIRRFEDLEAWQRARKLVASVYDLTRHPPLARDLVLCDQVRRAAISVMTNIAEGFERSHSAEKIQFYNIARASCGEVRSLAYVMGDASYLDAEQTARLQDLAISCGKLLSGLIRSTQARKP